MCTVLLPPGGNPTAVNKYIISRQNGECCLNKLFIPRIIKTRKYITWRSAELLNVEVVIVIIIIIIIIIIKEKGTCMLIDVAISGDRNVI